MIEKNQIILKHREGVSNREIARQLGVDKNTVNKYVEAYCKKMQSLFTEDPGADLEALQAEICEKPHYNTANRGPGENARKAIPIIKECLMENARKREDGRGKQQMRKIEIYDYLKKNHGIKISYSTVRRLVTKLEEEEKEAFIKQDHLPGKQTEFDWGTVTLNIGGAGYQKYQMAVFTSSYGNHRFARLYRTQDTAAFQEAHASYFAFCRGVYRMVVYDNMKVAVKKFVGPSEKEPTDALLELSAYYGFRFRFCNVRRGNEKGHVEKSVDVVRHAAFSKPGEDCFATLEDANRHLLEICREKNSEKLSDGRIPEETFQEELPCLMKLPPKMACFIKVTGLRVNKYATVTVNKVHYSVPEKLVGNKVDARIYTGMVSLYYDGKLVASHERHYRQGEYVLNILHYLRTLAKKPGALPQSSALMQSDTMIKKIYDTYYSTDPKEFLQVLVLIRDIGAEPVYTALKELEQKTTRDFSAAKVRLLYDRDAAGISVSNKGEDHPAIKEDRLSRKSKETLKQYDHLRDMQTRRAG